MSSSLPAFPPSCSLLLTLALAGCAQTDFVATEEALCLFRADCGGDELCPASNCSSGTGVPVQVGDGCGAEDPASQSFRFALCSCDDYVSEFPLVVEASDADGEGGSVGVNGTLTLGAGASIDGSLQVAGAIETGDGPAVEVSGRSLEAANLGCNCQPGNLLDVGARVAAARASNDNAAQSLDPRALDGFTSAETLNLSSGKLYLSRIAGSAPLTLAIDGAVQLHADGDVELDSTLTVTLAPGATLDLFIARNVRARALLLGDATTAGRLRVYVGGPGTINLEDTSLIGGSLYAPTAELVTRGPLAAHGPLFVRRAAPGAELRVRYDATVWQAGSCE